MINANQQIVLNDKAYSLQALHHKIYQKKGSEKEVTHLKLFYNFYPPILKELTTLNSALSHLIVLNLSYNNIESLQSLQKMSLLDLKELHLFCNNIYSLQSLRKCNLPRLEILSLVNNRLIELGSLWQTNLPQLQHLLAYDNNLQSAVNIIVRMNCPRLTHIILGETLEQAEFSQSCYMDRFEGYQPI